jgi:hypothetical protein
MKQLVRERWLKLWYELCSLLERGREACMDT